MKKNNSHIDIYTLGPKDTNCELAAQYWLNKNGYNGTIHLRSTLENAIEEAKTNKNEAIVLGCIVYHKLHHLVFQNIKEFYLSDCFIMPTHEMILATKVLLKHIKTIATHPAPVDLIPYNDQYKLKLVNSNSQAALECKQGNVDACITTMKSAINNNLQPVKNFGSVNMGFSIHCRYIDQN